MSFFYQIKFRAAWWRELKQLGYDVIPLRGKDSPYTGWPTMANGENDINFWNGIPRSHPMIKKNFRRLCPCAPSNSGRTSAPR